MPKNGVEKKGGKEEAVTLDELSNYISWQKRHPNLIKCFICQNVVDLESEQADDFVQVSVFDNRDNDKKVGRGGLEIKYKVCPSCFQVVKEKIVKHGDISDIMHHSCQHALEVEAAEELQGEEGEE